MAEIRTWLRVENGVVVSRNLWDGDPDTWAPPEGTTMLPDSDKVEIGALYDVDTEAFTAPPPVAPTVPDSVTETQFMRAAVRAGRVTGDEAEAYLARGVLPALIAGPLDKLSPAERTDARLKAIGADTFHRGDAIFALLVAGGVATDAEIDGLFQFAETMT